jgi:hypothetical protein
LEKVEEETQLFTNDDKINESNSKQMNSDLESNHEIINENFSDLNSDDTSDLEIPAFLRRQTN